MRQKVIDEEIISWFTVFSIKEDEDSIKVAIILCEAVGVKIECHEVEAEHYLLKRKQTSASPLIFQLVNCLKKEEIMCKAH